MFSDLFIKLVKGLEFPGKYRLLHKICPRTGEKVVNVFGYEVSLELADYIQRGVYLNVFEPEDSERVRLYLKPGMAFVDVGANIGYYSLLAARQVGAEGRVIAFEPSPYAFNKLNETVKLNCIHQISPVNAGLADQTGEISLYLPEEIGNHTPSMVSNGKGEPMTVPVLTLDEYVESCSIPQIDLMKIDVEGFEPNVIKGALRLISEGKIKAIMCEFNDYWLEANQTSAADLFSLLTENSFTFIDNKLAKCSSQNLFFEYKH